MINPHDFDDHLAAWRRRSRKARRAAYARHFDAMSAGVAGKAAREAMRETIEVLEMAREINRNAGLYRNVEFAVLAGAAAYMKIREWIAE